MNEFYFTIFLIIITLVFIGFFAGLEIAFVTANKLSIELKKKQGKYSGIILSKFMEKPARFIGTCLIGFNVFLVVYGLLFDDLLEPLWLRFHLEKAVENGVTKEELIEVITHLAFYAGWPNAMNAILLAKELFSKREASG